MLITGETRKLDAAEIGYAGPADREPPAPTPAPKAAEPEPEPERAEPPPPEPTRVPRVRFTANAEHTQFFYAVAGGYRRICVAYVFPADNLAAGVYAFAVRRQEPTTAS